MLMWTPTYFKQGLGLSLEQSGWFSVLPYMVMFICFNIFGFIGTRMAQSGWAAGAIRNTMQTIAFAGGAICMVALAHAKTPWEGVLALALTMALASASTAGYSAQIHEIAPKSSAIVLGISNTIATIPGIIGVPVMGWVYSHFSWSYVFYFVAVIYVVGMVIFRTLSSSKVQFVD